MIQPNKKNLMDWLLYAVYFIYIATAIIYLVFSYFVNNGGLDLSSVKKFILFVFSGAGALFYVILAFFIFLILVGGIVAIAESIGKIKIFKKLSVYFKFILVIAICLLAVGPIIYEVVKILFFHL